MWTYIKMLEYPVNIKTTNAKLAMAIISQLGGPDGEKGAATRYLSQRYAMPDKRVIGMLTDIGVSVSLLHTLFLNKVCFCNLCSKLVELTRSFDF